jgi:adiponectin receptor
MESEFVRDFPVWIFVLAGCFGAGGAVLYALKWPEKSFPGRFDFFGNSHNIFHFCVLVGQFLTWWGSIRVFHERQLYSCPT